MTNINLLPWRQERRAELKKQFFTIMGMFAAMAAVFIVLWQLLLVNDISTQVDRNKFMEARITELDEQVKEIALLKDKKKELIERMQVIESLQGNRPEIVHIFDELVRTLPDGVFFEELSRKDKTITIKGHAESNNRVSSLMRKLNDSELFSNPALSGVSSDKASGQQAVIFELVVTLTPPNITGEEGAEGTDAKGSAAPGKRNPNGK